MIDVDLIRRCKNKESEAFDELYKSCSLKALRTAYLLVGRKDIAEEAMQDAFFQCYIGIPKLKNPECFHVWFNRILIRSCRDASLKEARFKSENMDDDYIETLHDDYNLSDDIEQKQENIMVINAINKLSQPLRTTVILFYYNDMSIKEISKVMKCFEGTVKSRLHYAKKKLENELENQDEKSCIVSRQILGKE